MSIIVTRNISANAAVPMGLRHAGDEHAFDKHIGKYVVSARDDAKTYHIYTIEEMKERFEFLTQAEYNERRPLKYGYWEMKSK